MELKCMPVKKIMRYIAPILNKNFLEWKNLKKEIFSKSKIECPEHDDEKIEKIISSEPIIAFYAHWLKFPYDGESTAEFTRKTASYIKGFFIEEFKNEKVFQIFLLKYNLIGDQRWSVIKKMVEAASAIQTIRGSHKVSLKKILQNKRDYKLILKSSISADEWEGSTLLSLSWIMTHETDPDNISKLHQTAYAVLSKRKKELFS